MCWNVFGVWMYNLTPIVLYFYDKIRGEPSELGYIWHLYYPFDHTKPVTHMLVFVFEMFGGESQSKPRARAEIVFKTISARRNKGLVF